MAWTAGVDKAVGDVITDTIWNSYLGATGSLESVRQTAVRKTADEIVNNSATPQNDDHLLFAMAANEIWEFTLLLKAISVSATPDLRFTFAVPTGATGQWMYVGLQTTDALIYDSAPFTSAGVFGLTSSARLFFIHAIVVNSTTAGNLQFQWSQQSITVENTTVQANSCIIAHKLA